MGNSARSWSVPLILCTLFVVAGCVAGDKQEGTASPADAFLNSDKAVETVLAWLRTAYPTAALGSDLTWQAEDVVVLGPAGEPLAGAAERRFTADDWVCDVSWATVAPEFVTYQISLRSLVSGQYWEGEVMAAEGTVREEIRLQVMSESLASELAMQYVKGSPTYLATGLARTLQQVDSMATGDAFSWAFVFEFDSRHSGYGYSKGGSAVQVVTPHRCVVTVSSMEVVEAVMDGIWDMMAQRFVQLTNEQASTIAGLFVRTSPTFVYDGILGTLELTETDYHGEENAWIFVLLFESAHAGYGDRTGHLLAEVVTPHEARLTVQDGMVVNAILDGEWNMLLQRPCEGASVS